MKKSKTCMQEEKDDTAVRRNQTHVALIRPWWSSSSLLGAAQAWQQIQAFQEESNKRLEVLHRSPVHTSGEGDDENEEEQTQRAASRQMGQPLLRAAICGFRLVLFLILLGFPGMQKKLEKNLTRQVEEGEEEVEVRSDPVLTFFF